MDASVLIAFLDDTDVHHEAARAIVMQVDDFGVHTINLAETLVHGVRAGRLDEMATAIAAVSIHELPRTDAEPRSLAAVRAATGLRMPDCCALVAAEKYAARLATFDTRLAHAAADRGIEALGVDA
ncbi:type II toxin-antitoxin system VapC family toxin [Nocardioides acrostichi]|uniref:Ribonuclease VapC n=1 Tax=Nocardioides acrostichi TaxID=2784339 RepID=A0A930V212_9ACTN|nr:PIN domain-containing protein [Nocardioides acrostichi]MBF4161764.1 PIN domain-containing protein [Nocardioides acrostichi]